MGDEQFAAGGRARALRHQGRLDEALAAFREARRFSGKEGRAHAWWGSAETLRDMWKFDDALSEYDQAIADCPEATFLRCGRAATLADLGRLAEAIEAYSIPELRDDLVALNGKASVLKDRGDFAKAATVIANAIELYPADPVARCAQAEIMRLQGDLQGAL